MRTKKTEIKVETKIEPKVSKVVKEPKVKEIKEVKEEIKIPVKEYHEGKEIISKRMVIINGKEKMELTLIDGTVTIK